MDGRRKIQVSWLQHLQQHAALYRVLVLACLWITALYIVGPDLGVLYISASALLFFFCAHRHGGRVQGASGYSLLNRGGQRAAGEMSSSELDAHVRGIAPPQAADAGSGDGGRSFVPGGGSGAEGSSGGNVLGAGAVPEKNALLAELAEQRARRRAAAAAAAVAAPPP